MDEPADDWAALAAQSELAETAIVMVAVDAERWLGMAGGFVRHGPCGVAGLWGMWVTPSTRRRGLGQQLVEAVAEWAHSRGASRLELSVTERAHDAAALYEQLGFMPSGERRPLTSDPSLAEIFLVRPL